MPYNVCVKKQVFRLFLTKNNQIIMYFCVIMNSFNILFNQLALFLMSSLGAMAFAQNAKTSITAPEKLDELLQIKVELDRKASEEKQYTIQVHYGDFETTTAMMQKFDSIFPTLPSKIIFETPNYKIRAGSFITEREAMAVLTMIKRRFPSAFVLKP